MPRTTYCSNPAPSNLPKIGGHHQRHRHTSYNDFETTKLFDDGEKYYALLVERVSPLPCLAETNYADSFHGRG